MDGLYVVGFDPIRGYCSIHRVSKEKRRKEKSALIFEDGGKTQCKSFYLSNLPRKVTTKFCSSFSSSSSPHLVLNSIKLGHLLLTQKIIAT